MARGQLLVIGGAEDKEDECLILLEFLRLISAARGPLVVITAASQIPQIVGSRYREVFGRLDARPVETVDVSSRSDANRPEAIALLEQAAGIFFTGGDQLSITAFLGGTRLETVVRDRFQEDGLAVAGTSAGAAVMATTMITGGVADRSPQFGIVQMSPGMGLLPGVVIEQHFTQRGRVGRLLSAVAQHPGHLGIGIDENTAVVVTDDVFRTIGEGAVTVVDASDISYTNVHQRQQDGCLALYGVQLHIVPRDHAYDLVNRCPLLSQASVDPPRGRGAGSIRAA